jgi:hypothetical protein
MNSIKSSFVFDHFGVCAFDLKGNQVPALNVNLIALWAEHAVKNGYDPENLVIETSRGNWHVLKTDDGWRTDTHGYKVT